MNKNDSKETLVSSIVAEKTPASRLALLNLRLPSFLPDATQGMVRALDSSDLESVGVEALVMSVFHLMQKPGSSTIAALGGLHKMSGWSRPIVTDSGGFQAYSLIRQNSKFGRLSDQGIRFTPENGEREFQLTPEKSIQLQMSYGGDILICLDDCTHVQDTPAEQELSVERTIKWAKRCKTEYLTLLKQRKIDPAGDLRPLIFGVVQGGGDEALRRKCADALLEIGFDGFGYGGWPLDAEGNLVSEMLSLCREIIPAEFPMHALGVGHPESIVACAKMGYNTFDSALPTRDARNGRLYTFTSPPDTPGLFQSSKWFRYLYITDEKHFKSDSPISPGCECLACTRYSIGYLRHLHKCSDMLYHRLATLHNLRFMTKLMSLLKNS